MNFGDRLSKQLEEREISQKEFAAMLNIAPSTLNGYIKNKRQPDFELVVSIARTLNVSIDSLFGCETNSMQLGYEEQMLIINVRKLSGRRRKLLTEFIAAITEDDNDNV